MADWDDFSEDYDRVFLENPQYVDTIERMISVAAERDGVRVLDLGCGTGNVTASLLRRLEGTPISVVAVDPSAGMRKKCGGRFASLGAVEVREGDSLAIPAEDGGFDFVLSHLALHHVPPESRRDCAREIARVLAPGGTLVYADMFCDVDGDTRDPVRVRDIVDKMVGVALYCLDHGAFDMMQVMLSTLPADINSEGEYLTTVDTWRGILADSGFGGIEVTSVPPDEFGIRIITALKRHPGSIGGKGGPDVPAPPGAPD